MLDEGAEYGPQAADVLGADLGGQLLLEGVVDVAGGAEGALAARG